MGRFKHAEPAVKPGESTRAVLIAKFPTELWLRYRAQCDERKTHALEGIVRLVRASVEAVEAAKMQDATDPDAAARAVMADPTTQYWRP